AGVPGGRAEQRVLADLRFPAAARAAATRLAVRIDDHVADLAAVPAMAVDRPAGGDDPAPDAGVPVQVDQVVAVDRDAADVLGQRGEVGVVAHRDRSL